MNYKEYYELFNHILTSKHPSPPYDKETYFTYTKLGLARMRRWDKQLILNEALVETIKGFTKKQHWIVITEPWCGDAAHVIPFIIQLVAHNHLISYDLQLRDSEPFLIQHYLTKGSKSIPKLIVRNEHGNDLFTWGPRPALAQALIHDLKAANADADTQKIELQNWFNADKGVSFCEEIRTLMTEP